MTNETCPNCGGRMQEIGTFLHTKTLLCEHGGGWVPCPKCSTGQINNGNCPDCQGWGEVWDDSVPCTTAREGGSPHHD